jgi:glycine betaine/choline ABC-type transport system substrate-binding protein
LHLAPRSAIAQLDKLIHQEEIRRLNYQVKDELRALKEIVGEKLLSKGLGKSSTKKIEVG